MGPMVGVYILTAGVFALGMDRVGSLVEVTRYFTSFVSPRMNLLCPLVGPSTVVSNIRRVPYRGGLFMFPSLRFPLFR